MTSGIAFILHSPADAPYATELAGALSSLSAFPIEVSANAGVRRTQYGLGASCIVVWSREMGPLTNAVLAAMPQSLANVVVARMGDARLPEALLSDVVAKTAIAGNANADAPGVLEAVSRVQSRLSERNAHSRSSTTPVLAHAGASVAPARKKVFAVRSVWGLAATMAVVGVTAPVIAGRAGASNIDTADTNALPSDAAEAAAVTTAAVVVDDAGALIESAPVSVAAPDPAPVLQRASVTVAPDAPLSGDPTLETLATMLQPSPAEVIGVAHVETTVFEAAGALDPKAASVIAAMVSGSDVSDWKIEAAPELVLTSAHKPLDLDVSARSGK
jgi:hypothetical protein